MVIILGLILFYLDDRAYPKYYDSHTNSISANSAIKGEPECPSGPSSSCCRSSSTITTNKGKARINDSKSPTYDTISPLTSAKTLSPYTNTPFSPQELSTKPLSANGYPRTSKFNESSTSSNSSSSNSSNISSHGHGSNTRGSGPRIGLDKVSGQLRPLCSCGCSCNDLLDKLLKAMEAQGVRKRVIDMVEKVDEDGNEILNFDQAALRTGLNEIDMSSGDAGDDFGWTLDDTMQVSPSSPLPDTDNQIKTEIQAQHQKSSGTGAVTSCCSGGIRDKASQKAALEKVSSLFESKKEDTGSAATQAQTSSFVSTSAFLNSGSCCSNTIDFAANKDNSGGPHCEPSSPSSQPAASSSGGGGGGGGGCCGSSSAMAVASATDTKKSGCCGGSGGTCSCSCSTMRKKNQNREPIKINDPEHPNVKVDEDGDYSCGCGCSKPLVECSDCVNDLCEEVLINSIP
ncbi:hypothetical protein H4219_005264 [Mycoemilia scoparia]|uniref:Uncharacterized protein n=1 Tax=Mycoemilia scoparia TaxID=417184 RepID=A0A9W7ZPS6_9FUNG|nr:hypothetical protein H4219_005264 [Mycoemilia scoparia]